MKKKYLFFLIPILVIGILITLIFTMKLNQNELNESGNVTQSTTKSEKSINAENEATIKQTEVQKQQIEELKSEILFQNVKWGTSFPEINNKFSNWKLLNLHGEGYQTYSTDDILLGSYKGLRFDYSGINVISSALKQQEIAGYTTSEINLYFAFLPVDGCLTYSESDTSLYGAQYVFKPTDLNAVYEDLKNKLSQQYGTPSKVTYDKDLRNNEYSYTYWYGENDTELVLKGLCGEIDTSGYYDDKIYISYVWRNGDTLLKNASDAVKAEKNSKEKDAQSNNNTNGL